MTPLDILVVVACALAIVTMIVFIASSIVSVSLFRENMRQFNKHKKEFDEEWDNIKRRR